MKNGALLLTLMLTGCVSSLVEKSQSPSVRELCASAEVMERSIQPATGALRIMTTLLRVANASVARADIEAINRELQVASRVLGDMPPDMVPYFDATCGTELRNAIPDFHDARNEYLDALLASGRVRPTRRGQ